uniref:hypothetical protein n=1 Tax=Alistipes sp. TaxID=1872444 RepID=UPI004056DB29
MRKIFKLMMSVVAMAAVVGCTTDVTEDLGVKVGGKTQLTLSLDGTRTQLGTKDEVKNIYPLTWSENDQVSVNGVVSDELTVAQGAGTANAVFTFGGKALSTPYIIAYPAVDVANQVKFAAEQYYNNNTSFESGVTTMFGYSKDGTNVKLQHLTGVLKIGVEGNATIVSARITTIDRKPIAGNFNVAYNAEKEELSLTPVKDATFDVITYNFDTWGDGLDLTMQDGTTYMYVTVPAIDGGVYNELYVTLTDNGGGIMYATVKTDTTKPLEAGKIREFKTAIKYAAMDSADTFVISDFSSLESFKNTLEAAQAVIDNADATDDEKAAATATLSKNATVVNDISISKAEINDAGGWDSINAVNYTGTINGNGYQISGLPTPLFDKTAASFRGLHINTSIKEEENPNFGVFARQLVANGNAPKVEHCSIRGTITINTAVKATSDSFSNAPIGAFAGIAKGVHFENCVNNAAINVNSILTSDATATACPVGGFVGYADTANSIFVSFTNCENKGKITFVTGDMSKVKVYAAGIVAAYRGANAVVTFDNLSNSGDIEMNANVYSINAMGGIIGYSNGTTTSPKTFTFNNAISNSGNIYKIGVTTNATRIGGILGYLDNSVTAIFNGPVTNSGAITFSGNQTNESVNIAGIIGHMNTEGCKATFNNTVTNTETADIRITGTAPSNIYCGGLIARAYRGDEKTACVITFSGKTATNNGEIYIKTNPGSTSYIGGIVGYTYLTATKFGGNCKVLNNGPITIDNSTFKGMYVGGIWAIVNGGGSSVVSDSSKGMMANTADITFSGKTTGGCYIGGIAGYHNLGTSVPAIQTGNLNITATFDATKAIQVGGAYGQHRGGLESSKITMQNAQVYCDIVAYSTTKNSDGTYTFTPYNQVGIFSGQSSINAINNNKVGGRIALGGTVEGDVVSHNWTTMNSENYISYLLGVRDYQTNSQTNNTLLTSKEQIDWGNYGN